jgi:hypothetical protein
MDRSSDLFFPVTNAIVLGADARLGDGEVDVVLVNRSYLRGVKQVDEFVLASARESQRVPPAS